MGEGSTPRLSQTYMQSWSLSHSTQVHEHSRSLGMEPRKDQDGPHPWPCRAHGWVEEAGGEGGGLGHVGRPRFS